MLGWKAVVEYGRVAREADQPALPAFSRLLRGGLDEPVDSAEAVIIATGARCRRLPLDRLAEFEGVGVYYAATQMEAQACRG